MNKPTLECLREIASRWKQDKSIINLINADTDHERIKEALENITSYLEIVVPALTAVVELGETIVDK